MYAKGPIKMLGMVQPHSSYFDFAVLGVIVSSWFQVIPSVAALLAVVWYVILIWESATVRRLTNREEEDYLVIVPDKAVHPDQPDEGK